MGKITTAIAALFTLVICLMLPPSAHAQFGNAGAVNLGPQVPGVDMPYFGVYNYANRQYDLPSTFSDATAISSIVQIRLEGVFDQANPGLHPRITNALMLPADFAVDPWPAMWAGTSPNAPSHTDVRHTRNFGREVYNDMAIVWNHLPFGVDVAPNTAYDLYIFVDWPAGVGQGFGVPYSSGSTVLSVRYTVTP